MPETMESKSASTSTKSATPFEVSQLLELPAELRNHIYRLVLVVKAEIKVDKCSVQVRKVLLDTCSQVREEASSIFYSENCFAIILDGKSVRNLALWLLTLRSKARFITSLRIEPELCDAALERFCDRLPYDLPNLDEMFMDGLVEERAKVYDLPKIRQALITAGRAGLAKEAITYSLDPVDYWSQPNQRTVTIARERGWHRHHDAR